MQCKGLTRLIRETKLGLNRQVICGFVVNRKKNLKGFNNIDIIENGKKYFIAAKINMTDL